MTPRCVANAGESHCEELLEAMHRGDVRARDELMERLYRRLVSLARVVHRGFPGLVGHAPESILHTAWIRLGQALDKERPTTVAAFFGLAAHKIRQTLLDLVEVQQRHALAAPADGRIDPGRPIACLRDSTFNPERLARWTELHREVDGLAPDEREVFTLRYYSGLSLAEIAVALGIHPKQASRLWLAASRKLAKALPGFQDVL